MTAFSVATKNQSRALNLPGSATSTPGSLAVGMLGTVSCSRSDGDRLTVHDSSGPKVVLSCSSVGCCLKAVVSSASCPGYVRLNHQSVIRLRSGRHGRLATSAASEAVKWASELEASKGCQITR